MKSKEEADEEEAGDEEDEGMKTNLVQIDGVNLTPGKCPGVGSEGEETDEEECKNSLSKFCMHLTRGNVDWLNFFCSRES